MVLIQSRFLVCLFSLRISWAELVQLAEEVVATIDNLPQLGRLTAKLGGAQDAEQACKILSQLVQ